MKIYEFKYKTGETDWVLAPNIKEAREYYLSFTGCGDLDDCEVKSIPKNKWGEYTVLDTEDFAPYADEDCNEEEYRHGYRILETFADFALRENSTCIIATTEF